jgi:hypothetical protein
MLGVEIFIKDDLDRDAYLNDSTDYRKCFCFL